MTHLNDTKSNAYRWTKQFCFVVALVIACLAGTSDVRAQQARLDWRMHNVGKVRQLVTNLGTLWKASTNYPGLIYSEYPPNSFEEHLGEGGIWVGALVGGDTLVSVASSWNSSFEFYPGAQPEDSIWVVTKTDTLDTPWLGRYTAVSDQDFLMKYSDYNVTNIGTHEPMYVDVIQTSYAWAAPPLDEVIVYTFRIIPTRFNLQQAYIALWVDGNVGFRGQGWDFALDDYSEFYVDRKLAVSRDAPGNVDGTAISPIGFRIYAPEGYEEDDLRWTFNWYPGQGMGAPPTRDDERYEQMAAGDIMANQDLPIGSQYMVAFGPFDLAVGDTLTFRIGQALGEGFEGMMANVETLDWLVSRDFKVPSPPPSPRLRAMPSSRSVTLQWEPLPGDVNPEQYKDPNRADNAEQPFEGYRLYKSTRSADGPWTLLAEFDVAANAFNANTGLSYAYEDVGLLNNFEYFYTITAFSKPDTVANFPSQESSLGANAVRVVPGTEPPATVGRVAVVPNPYRGDAGYESFNPPWEKPPSSRSRWLEQDRRIQFINLPGRCTIRIYTLAGDPVQTLHHESETQGYEDWNLTSSVGQAIASGIYLFTVEDLNNGEVQTGTFVVIK